MPPATRLAPASAYMPIFAPEDGVARFGRARFCARCLSRDAAFRLVRGPVGACRRVIVAPRVLLAESFGRFAVRVVALRVVPPASVSRAALDALPGFRALRRSDAGPGFVAVLDLARLDLPLESSAAAGAVRPRVGLLAARLFPARRPASGFRWVDVRAALAGTSVISTSPNSDTGRSGTKRPSSPALQPPSAAA
jgi:hypothetical protein